VTTADAVFSPSWVMAQMLAVPGFTAVTFPSPVTDVALGLSVAQLTALLVAPAGITVAVNSWDSPFSSV